MIWVPRAVVPSWKVTVPVGIPVGIPIPGTTGENVAVNVICCPRLAGFRDELSTPGGAAFPIAILCHQPPARAATPVRPAAWTGIGLSVKLLFPSWPLLLCPQAHAVPSLLNARLCSRPATTATTLVRPLTRTGTALFVVLLSPNCPSKLAPHAQTAPSLVSARL
jgi:hypothetical protein